MTLHLVRFARDLRTHLLRREGEKKTLYRYTAGFSGAYADFGTSTISGKPFLLKQNETKTAIDSLPFFPFITLSPVDWYVKTEGDCRLCYDNHAGSAMDNKYLDLLKATAKYQGVELPDNNFLIRLFSPLEQNLLELSRHVNFALEEGIDPVAHLKNQRLTDTAKIRLAVIENHPPTG